MKFVVRWLGMGVCSMALVAFSSHLCGCADHAACSHGSGESATNEATVQPESKLDHTGAMTASVVVVKPAPADGSTAAGAKERTKMKTEIAMFGAGCFWGVEAAFQQVKGVTKTEVGYSGGEVKNPTYKDVCNKDTGHAEVVRVEFDRSQVSYEQLLDVFWENHDPTQLNRQGPDFGSQYRSAIFFLSSEQEATAKASKEKLAKSGKFSRPIVTEISKASDFWRAEEYHQQYLEKRGLKVCH